MLYTQAPILLNCLSYDGIGRLIGKNIGGSVVNNTLTFAENLTMSYNIRNWLTSINGKSAKNDLFKYSLQYTEAGQFNGNIGKMILNNRATSYTYDGINRLTLADGLDAAGKQMIEKISYDLNGNILSLNRTMGGVEIDRLAYSYKPNSNQLQAVTDNIVAHNGLGYYDGNKTATNFTYDNNGSMTSDLDKSLTLTYNRLNLVQTAHINSSKQVYLYNTQGNKMAQKVDGQNKAYLFGSEYVNGELSRMQTAEGFVSKNLNWKDGSTDKKYPYSFTVSDHLGNIRVVVDEQGQVQQKNEYTAFGVVQSTGPSKNKYLFNNKELQTGTNYLDYGARMYQPELGRWNVVDPLGENHVSETPFSFSGNNPIMNIDPDGLDWYRHDETGALLWRDSQAGNISVNDQTFNNVGTRYAWTSSISNGEGGNQTVLNIGLADGKTSLITPNEYNLVRFPESGNGFARYTGNGGGDSYELNGVGGQWGDNWANPGTAASLYNTIQQFNKQEPGVIVHYGDISAYDPSINLRHQTHTQGNAIDIHYMGAGGQELSGNYAYSNADVRLTNSFMRKAESNGFVNNYSYGNRFIHRGNNNHKIHKNHFHIAKQNK